mgnify:FL=1|jgi:hypothetical protein
MPRVSGEEAVARVREMLRIGLDGIAARDAWAEGRECECDEPNPERGLMCRNCRLLVRSAVHKREKAINSPHEFIQHRAVKLPMCAVCSGWPDDPRHSPTGEES